MQRKKNQNQSKGLEQREYARVEKTLPIKLSLPDFDIVTETKNVSGNAVYCAIDKPLLLMTKLDIVILLAQNQNKEKDKNAKKIHCHVVVVRKDYSESDHQFQTPNEMVSLSLVYLSLDLALLPL